MSFFDWIKNLFKKPAPKLVVLPPPPAPPSPQQGKTLVVTDWPVVAWTEWTVEALHEIAPDLLAAHPKDAGEWTSGETYDPVQLYSMLLSALAKFESDYATGALYTEKFKDRNGHYVVSRGLLQISLESANGNYAAGLRDEKELHDPRINIRTGVRIMRKLILQDGVISGGSDGAWKGMARYWSPFRKPERVAYLKGRTRSLK